MDPTTPSDSSSEDFYTESSVAAPAAQDAPVSRSVAQLLGPGSGTPANTAPGLPPAGSLDDEDRDDSSVDMDLSDPSRPSTPAYAEPVCKRTAATASHFDAAIDAAAAAAFPATNYTGVKRKLSDAVHGTNVGAQSDSPEEPSKKRRLSDPDTQNGGSRYTPPMDTAIWQRIFTYLSPAMLSRCLRVSKSFTYILTKIKAAPGKKKNKTVARLMDSEVLWTQARKAFFPMLPRPLARFNELEMLQLVGGLTCQFCGKVGTSPPATSFYNCGPGHNGVRVIFAFGVRTCGPCIDPYLRTDVQLLAQGPIAQLRLGTPHAFRNGEHHFVSETVRQTPQGIPGALRFSKVYHQSELDAVKHEEEEALQLGQGAVDEWRKGLFSKGKDIMADAARWEKWELQLPLGANPAHVLREYDVSSFPRHLQRNQSRSAGVNGLQPPVAVNDTPQAHPHPLPQPVHVFPAPYGQPPQPHSLPPGFPPPFLPPGYPPNFQLPFSSHQQQTARPARNPQEVESARQARKAEIERRCKELEPPVEPNLLQHMESFQAAMQITTPLTDAAWDMLKPRILAQRDSAELAEHARASQLAALQAAIPSTSMDDLIPKPAKETYDREYEDAQAPLRKRLEEYADDLINGQWVGGKVLDGSNTPIFAIQVLQHVRQRYNQDKELAMLPKFEPPPVKKGQDPPLEPFLSLDNMKWVYDNKVRPLTDVHCKEHFLCAGCDEERKPKWFAFEGLIQHYGAKHTSSFSKGNIIVHWQTAQWPDQPPFHTNPGPWLKMDRRVSDHKGPNRHRNAPRSNHEGSYRAPPVHHQSQAVYNPANGPPAHPPGYPPAHNGHSTNHIHLPPRNGFSSAQADAQFNGAAAQELGADHDAQVRKLSGDARDTWDALDGVKDLLACIRVHTALHHSVTKFVDQFRNYPALDLLTDALATNNSMRPLKNASGLACKLCVAAGDNFTSTSYWTRIRGVKLQTTSALIMHFKLAHEAVAEWTQDMVEIPEPSIVRQLLRTPGMDDGKLGLIAAAFPGVFVSPLPKIGTVNEEGSSMSTGSGATSLLDRLAKKGSKPKKKTQKNATNGVQERDGSQEPLSEAREDEYDPLRPALVPKNTWDPAQFDTDARKPSASASVPKLTESSQPASLANAFNLAPETLAALQKFNSSALAKVPSPGARDSRSPSVGRAHSASLRPQATITSAPGPPAAVVTPTGQPDIAAILASLTGQAQQATPPTTASIRPGSAVGPSHAPPYSKPVNQPSPSHQNDVRRSSSRYDGLYQAPPPPIPAQGHPDVQSSLAHNTRQYEHNQQPAYVERSYAAQPQYPYGYEGGHTRAYSQPSSHSTVYRDSPVQYIQMLDRGQDYHYQHPAPQTIYLDQNGRPLIPVDSAPAPVHYAPHPYEQQQYVRKPPEHQVYGAVVPQQHLQPVYDQSRTVRYEQHAPYPGNALPARYSYDDGRASVPRS